MTNVKAPIVDHYDKVAFYRDSDSSRLTRFTDESRTVTVNFDENWISDLKRRVFNDNRRLFRDFDYNWALEDQNFSTPMEQYIQLKLLDVLADVSPDHPNYLKFGNICFRISNTANMNAESFTSESYKYVCVTSAYVKYIKEFLYTFFEIYAKSGADNASSGRKRTSGQAVYDELSRRPLEHETSLARLIHTGFSYSRYKIPLDLAPPVWNHPLFGEHIKAEYGPLIIGADLFLALHELGHILEHTFKSTRRNHREEIEADRAASSLFLIASARDPVLASVHARAPALAFSVLRHFNMIRRVAKIVDKSISDPDQMAGELEEERLLLQRVQVYRNFVADNFMARDFADAYWSGLDDFFVLIAASQVWLLRWAGQRTKLSDLIKRPSRAKHPEATR
ncbi:hypothetical protein ACIQUG_20605 [Ensifer sp. NPDC090286]|uniref:hypothetical protein n=1 Tax=Ensifer sp. NPDC090286 TaxID=3363991 RepID=UPI00383AC8FA